MPVFSARRLKPGVPRVFGPGLCLPPPLFLLMGQGVVLSGRAAAGKDAVCAFISILAGAGGPHTLVMRGKGGHVLTACCVAHFVSQLRTASDRAAVQNNYLLDSVGFRAHRAHAAMQQKCRFYRDSTRFFDSCVPTDVRSVRIQAESDIKGIAAHIFCRIGLGFHVRAYRVARL